MTLNRNVLAFRLASAYQRTQLMWSVPVLHVTKLGRCASLADTKEPAWSSEGAGLPGGRWQLAGACDAKRVGHDRGISKVRDILSVGLLDHCELPQICLAWDMCNLVGSSSLCLADPDAHSHRASRQPQRVQHQMQGLLVQCRLRSGAGPMCVQESFQSRC